ncbi:hypothetical protein DPSP01_010045 [Paraphaeosphaeria sporulosa]
MANHSNATKRRRTCKTGCLTCKARKVKCDEGKPACHRCISTGRTCDGYGIWGGGGNHVEAIGETATLLSRNSQHPRLLVNVPVSRYTLDEQLYLDWFYVITVPKIPGLFPHRFWNTLLRQASVTEPAVFHATLTLSSAHKTTRGDENATNKINALNEQDAFMLRNYSKAIHHLQPHLTTKDRASTRVALIACAVFTCLEFLRGNFKTAQTHLRSGMRVLQEYGNEQNGVVILRATDATDQWIIETFQRLHMQVALFHRTHLRPAFIILQHQPSTTSLNSNFETLQEAWNELNAILYKIVALKGNVPAHQIRASHATNHGTCDSELIPHQQQLQASLHHWHTTYLTCKPHLDPQEPTLVINAVMLNFYALASILCATSLSTELAYDAHTAGFLAILANSIHLWKSRPPEKICDKAGFNMAHSIVDFGWVPPLYYTAVKCRVRRIRSHAVRLLESTLHREGIWDCRIMSMVMRRVMDLEDDGLCGDDEGLALDMVPRLDGLEQPVLPLERRVGEIKVEMEDEMVESVMVEYRKAWRGAQWERVRVALTTTETRLDAVGRWKGH